MAGIARFTNSNEEFLGLLITPNTNLTISETTELGETNVVVTHNGTRHRIAIDYSLEDVITIIEEAYK